MNDGRRLYTPQFFQVLVGAWLTMTGVSMQFHFGEYVAYVGHSVNVLGWITGIGVVGSLLVRPYSGAWIDRVGCRPCWLAAAFVGAVANVSFQWTDTVWIICLLRILMTVSTATFLTTVAVYAAQVAPPRRRAESMGSVGIGGFFGMMAGPVIGDLIFESGGATSESFALFFTLVGAMSLLAGVAVSTVPSPTRRKRGDGIPFRTLMHRYWPGMILMVSLVFTTILTIHMTFLERYAHFRAFENIRWFFLIYAPTAIILRVVFRRVPERYGRRRLCVFGLATMGVGLLLLIPVQAEWHLIFPAFLLGVGHTFIFPSMVDLAADALPEEHRGVGTSLVLGAGDIGFLLGSIAWGHLIEFGSYETTFITGSLLAFASAAAYFWTQRKKIIERSRLNTAASATSR